MDGAPSESHASGSQVPSLLRQRMLNRAATFAEGAQSSPPALPRRRSSLLSDHSDSRYSFRSSTENLVRTGGNNDMDKLASSDEPTHWTSLPVAFAIVPVIFGMTHENGGAIATDTLMLALASWFLHWCVRVPWDWYHEAQQRQYQYDEVSGATYDDTILEQDEDSIGSLDQRLEQVAEGREESNAKDRTENSAATEAQRNAQKALRREELQAFAACFLGPVLGAYLLHAIRGQLARTEGVVSDFNLVIFILAAEIRPVARLIKMKKERMLHLQRVVRAEPRDRLNTADAQQISHRLAELEARLEGPVTTDVDVGRISAEVRQNTQVQLDALNRAVRRYEKRHMAQSIQLEARFQNLESRLMDALSLAAAAARTGQRPGIITVTVSWFVSMVKYTWHVVWSIAMYPLRTAASAIAILKSYFVKDERQARRRGKAQVNGYSPISTPRMQSKTGR